MTRARSLLALFPAALLAAGCSKGSTGGGGAATGTSGIAVPREISALPTSSTSAQSLVRAPSLVRSGQALAADSDYELAHTVKFVDERALSQFEILNTIFNAMGQTHYADAANVGAGPYGAVVSWVEQKGDSDQKLLVPWVVDSTMVTEDGTDVNRVFVWMKMQMGDGEEHLIKVEMNIYEPPVQRADGSYADYGAWRIDASFDDSGMAYFAASATHDASGRSVVAIHEKEGPQREIKGIMQRSDDAGAGLVVYPDERACWGPEGGGPDCNPPLVTVAYAYNADHVALQSGDEPVIYKDRNDPVDIVNRYGLFDAATGADVARSHSFGFPIRYTDGQGRQHWGYYGAWQGRHQIWSDGQQSIPAGTTVTRADRPPNQAAETYEVSDSFKGTLVKRTLVPADIQDIKDIVVETWVNQNYSFRYEGGQWLKCNAPQPNEPQVCDAPFDGNWESFAYNPSDRRRFVGINYNQPPEPVSCSPYEPCPQPPPSQPVNLVYCADAVACPLASSPGLPGLYVATMSQNGPPTPTDQRWIDPEVEGGNLWVNVGGSTYIQFNGTSWVQKKVLSFDEQTWMPTFDSTDVPYTLEQGREYYINNPGANYIVKLTGSGTYDVQIELQSVANPVNVGSFVSAGTEFRPQWGGSDESTYEFVSDSTSSNFLKLVYKTVGSRDEQSGVQVGAVLESGQWGLVAYVEGTSSGVQYNWDYPREGENWGSQQFLLNADGTYKILDNPLRFLPVVLVNHAGVSKTYSLQFDGSWVNGLPDIHRELERNDFVVTQEIADKVVAIPAGTEVIDAEDETKRYLFKPLQVNQYLYVIPDPEDVDVSAASALDLGQVPTYAGHGMGDMPEVPVKYSEGNLVE
jgi:hypothetical protein